MQDGINYLLHNQFQEFARLVNPTLSEFVQIAQMDFEFAHALDTTLTDSQGNHYTDWIAGYGSFNLGHNPPALLAAMQKHLSQQVPGLYFECKNPFAGTLAANLNELTEHQFANISFCNSGSETVDAAIKLAVAASGRTQIAYFANAYHGVTIGALGLMSKGLFRDRFEGLIPRFIELPFNQIDGLQEALKQHRPAAVILEPIQIEAGVIAANPEFVSALRDSCDELGIVLVFDEIQTGLGRCGSWFYYQQLGIVPDILCLAKSLGAGLTPIGALLSRHELFKTAYGDYLSCEIQETTYGSNSLACFTADQALRLMQSMDLPGRCRQRSQHLNERLQGLSNHPLVERITLHGLIGAIEIKPIDHPWLSWEHFGVSGMTDAPSTVALLIQRLHKHNILAQLCGHNWNVLRIEPPLTISEAECDHFVKSVQRSLDWLSQFSQ